MGILKPFRVNPPNVWKFHFSTLSTQVNHRCSFNNTHSLPIESFNSIFVWGFAFIVCYKIPRLGSPKWCIRKSFEKLELNSTIQAYFWTLGEVRLFQVKPSTPNPCKVKISKEEKKKKNPSRPIGVKPSTLKPSRPLGVKLLTLNPPKVKVSKEKINPSRPLGVKPLTLHPPKVKISKERRKPIRTIRV